MSQRGERPPRDRKHGERPPRNRQHGEKRPRERQDPERESSDRQRSERQDPERESSDRQRSERKPRERQKREGVSEKDATTKSLRRPALTAIGEPPDYPRQRVIVLSSLAMVIVGVVAVTIATDAGGGEASRESNDPVAETVTSSAPTPTTNVPTTVEKDLPIHHGYNDEALYVALYGSISTDSLGVLGENDPAGSVERAAEVAEEYEGFGSTVVPTFEIIASVASFDSGDGDYSNEASVGALEPWVDAADEAGYHVVLDLQSGRENFSSQVTEFEPLLLEPHVGVALDPEWRVGPNGVPEGGKIGSVTASEVNSTINYLDQLVEENDLPPKMLIVHQFTDDMIQNKAEIRDTDNVQVVIHMDGFGPLTLKQGSYARILLNLPDGAVTGWKNFYDEDKPTPSANETMENDPEPMFVSFQ